VTVGDSLRPSVMLEYFVADNLGIEVLAAWPFSHDVELNGTKAATVDHLPPTLSLQYHFNGSGAISPYLGVGLNYTLFFSEDTTRSDQRRRPESRLFLGPRGARRGQLQGR
jgi:outer membrane protein